MNKKAIILICLTLVVVFFFSFKALAGKETEKTPVLGLDTPVPTEPQKEKSPSPASQKDVPADRIEVFHFHATRQCPACIAVGEYALETIKNKFPEEYQSGKIIYRDINGELPENKEVVIKYQAVGSSLFINAISDNEDNIEEDTTVWRLINNQDDFTVYFENKLKTLL